MTIHESPGTTPKFPYLLNKDLLCPTYEVIFPNSPLDTKPYTFTTHRKTLAREREMDAIRKQLDVLMGANRNGDVREVNRKYYDRDVCRLFLVGLCPHELFQLTVRTVPPSLSTYICIHMRMWIYLKAINISHNVLVFSLEEVFDSRVM